jgi:hypothetical protein
MVGHVKLTKIEKEYNKSSLYDSKSSIHKRLVSGVEIPSLGYISNSGNKMTYTKKNAISCVDILKRHFLITDTVSTLVLAIKPYLFEYFKKLKREYSPIFDPLLHITFKRIFLSQASELQFVTEKQKEECARYVARELLKSFQNKENVLNVICRTHTKNQIVKPPILSKL